MPPRHNIILNPPPSPDWSREYSELLSDTWLKRKTDRQRRLREHADYLSNLCPELKEFASGLCIDIGPGCGETLEIAREFGHDILGIDAEAGHSGMGNEYLRVSQLMCERQKVPVRYVGFLPWLREGDPTLKGTAVFVNMRGSIEQALSRYQIGEPHHVHQNCKNLDWKVNGRTRDIFVFMFTKFKEFLRPGGKVVIHANGTGKTDEWYDFAIRSAAKEAGMRIEMSEGLLLHKWERP